MMLRSLSVLALAGALSGCAALFPNTFDRPAAACPAPTNAADAPDRLVRALFSAPEFANERAVGGIEVVAADQVRRLENRSTRDRRTCDVLLNGTARVNAPGSETGFLMAYTDERILSDFDDVTGEAGSLLRRFRVRGEHPGYAVQADRRLLPTRTLFYAAGNYTVIARPLVLPPELQTQVGSAAEQPWAMQVLDARLRPLHPGTLWAVSFSDEAALLLATARATPRPDDPEALDARLMSLFRFPDAPRVRDSREPAPPVTKASEAMQALSEQVGTPQERPDRRAERTRQLPDTDRTWRYVPPSDAQPPRGVPQPRDLPAREVPARETPQTREVPPAREALPTLPEKETERPQERVLPVPQP